MTETVSVVIPTTGGRADLLARAVRSAYAQTRPPQEVLVVVDGGEELRRVVAGELGRDDVKTLVTGAPAGASAARNLGGRAALGDFLAFLDDDDVWKQDYLEALFAEGGEFDVGLAAFEKHSQTGVRPEKVPPEALSPSAFFVANPGLRGSNLVVRRERFLALRGFDESLPAFNDMDFGLRLARAGDLRYRRVTRPMVEYHAHGGTRLTARGSPWVGPGASRFLSLHGPDMTWEQEAAFRQRARDLWGVDPWTHEAVQERADRAKDELERRFGSLLHAAETVLVEASCRSKASAQRQQELVDEVCRRFERQRTRPCPLLQLAVVTTDVRQVESLLTSLSIELDRSRWGTGARGTQPRARALVLVNSEDGEGEARLGRVDPRIEVALVAAPCRGRPLPIAWARAELFRELLRREWRPSHDAPVWVLDDDFRFDVLLPDPEATWTVTPGGSLLHRMEQLVRRTTAAALVGGNSGAAPVPAAGLLGLQLEDLARAGPTCAEAFEAYLSRRDPYYGLSEVDASDLAMPLERAWWQARGGHEEAQADEVGQRLVVGLPVTRPATATLRFAPGQAPSAWAREEVANVAGGNTILLDPRMLRPDWFVHVRLRDVISRRADSAWAALAQASGLSVERVGLPLRHDRCVRSAAAPEREAASAAVADVLGFGVYRVLRARGGDALAGGLEEACLGPIRDRARRLREHLDRASGTLRAFDGRWADVRTRVEPLLAALTQALERLEDVRAGDLAVGRPTTS